MTDTEHTTSGSNEEDVNIEYVLIIVYVSISHKREICWLLFYVVI